MPRAKGPHTSSRNPKPKAQTEAKKADKQPSRQSARLKGESAPDIWFEPPPRARTSRKDKKPVSTNRISSDDELPGPDRQPSPAEPEPAPAPAPGKDFGESQVVQSEAERGYQSRSIQVSLPSPRLTNLDNSAAKLPTRDRGTNTGPRIGNIPSWLEHVYSDPIVQDREDQPREMPRNQARPSSETAPTRTSERPTDSQRTATQRKVFEVTWDKLGYRFIRRKRSRDPNSEIWENVVTRELPRILNSDAGGVADICEKIANRIRTAPKEVYLDNYDDLAHEVEEENSRKKLPTIHQKRFDFYVLDNQELRNEAWLQRTLMPVFLDSLWLDRDTFSYTAESVWKVPFEKMIRSTVDDFVSQPKPDCAISFVKEAITGKDEIDAPVPPLLKPCLCPDDSADRERNFPFLFIEVKKGATDTEGATISSFHAASQALYNIYHWMKESEELDTFFTDVRVFSFVFNATQLGVRVHRAEKKARDRIAFEFDTIWRTGQDGGFTRNQACMLVPPILNDYAKPTLLPLLQRCFAKVSAKEHESVSKRKADASNVSRAKRARNDGSSSVSAEQSSSNHTGSTQDLEALNMV